MPLNKWSLAGKQSNADCMENPDGAMPWQWRYHSGRSPRRISALAAGSRQNDPALSNCRLSNRRRIFYPVLMRLQPPAPLSLAKKLRAAGLRPTRQRLALASILFDGTDRHVTAETLFAEAQARRMPVVLATVYNALHQFRDAGLLREVLVAPERCYFDTNTSDHHHFYVEPDGMLVDIPAEGVAVQGLPRAPVGTTLRRVDVVVRVRR
jgi:Fur family iron response transcriptional regulator